MDLHGIDLTGIPKNKALLIFIKDEMNKNARSPLYHGFDHLKTGRDVIELGITSSIDSLKKMLNSLKAKGDVCVTVLGTWLVTAQGSIEAENWENVILNANACCDDADDEDDQLSDSRTADWNDIAQKFMNEAKHWEDIAASFANTTKVNSDSLQEIKSLKQTIDSLKAENARLATANNQLSKANANLHVKVSELQTALNKCHEHSLTLCDKLAAETKERERLENCLSKLSKSFTDLHSWTNAMKNGSN